MLIIYRCFSERRCLEAKNKNGHLSPEARYLNGPAAEAIHDWVEFPVAGPYVTDDNNADSSGHKVNPRPLTAGNHPSLVRIVHNISGYFFSQPDASPNTWPSSSKMC